MGPTTLFDKSFLQSLSLDESVWFDHFFYPNICPLFYVETLADLKKPARTVGRTPEDEVAIIAAKTPDLSGGPCTYHQTLCLGELLGHRVPMTGQIPLAGGRAVKTADGRAGVVYEHSPESEAFSRWQQGKFFEVEHAFAQAWRAMLETLDLDSVATRMRGIGIDSGSCKSLEDASRMASQIVQAKKKPFDQLALLFAFVSIPEQYAKPVLQRWHAVGYRPLAEYAPYSAHVLAVELFFQIALAAHLISTRRASNRIDIAYLFYLPFCTLFVSGDKLHQACAPLFLRSDQEFIWAAHLKADLARLNREFAKLPEAEKERGLMKFASDPIGDPADLIIRIWDQHLPKWRERRDATPMTPEANDNLVKYIRELTDAPASAPPEDLVSADPEHLAITRNVPKRKGNWWLLPKDLPPNDSAAK